VLTEQQLRSFFATHGKYMEVTLPPECNSWESWDVMKVCNTVTALLETAPEAVDEHTSVFRARILAFAVEEARSRRRARFAKSRGHEEEEEEVVEDDLHAVQKAFDATSSVDDLPIEARWRELHGDHEPQVRVAVNSVKEACDTPSEHPVKDKEVIDHSDTEVGYV
jgi:hypothetical protein